MPRDRLFALLIALLAEPLALFAAACEVQPPAPAAPDRILTEDAIGEADATPSRAAAAPAAAPEGASQPDHVGAERAGPGPADERHAGARQLFLTACASCHGADGSGRGAVQLDRPARSFLEGGFSFGNTPEAVARTITFGIPGTPMPAFGGACSESECRLLAEYVLSLGPGSTDVDAAATVLTVGERPVVVRGILPAIAEGTPLRPRGLLVGTPAGLSFEYRIDDVRLLGVRQGEFVARDDWIGRGGSPLRPLGVLVLLEGDGDPPPTFAQSTLAPLHAQLTSTAIRDEVGATLAYRLERENGTPQAYVEERVEPWADASGSGWTRHLALLGSGLNANDLVLTAVPPLNGRSVRPMLRPPRATDELPEPTWFDVASEGGVAFQVGVRAVSSSPGAPVLATTTVGADGGLRAQFRLEPEQLLELDLITFFRTAAPEEEAAPTPGKKPR